MFVNSINVILWGEELILLKSISVILIHPKMCPRNVMAIVHVTSLGNRIQYVEHEMMHTSTVKPSCKAIKHYKAAML